MKVARSLDGRHVAVLVADGFEKGELAIPVKVMRAAGAEVDIISLRHGRIRGVHLHEPASTVRVTKTVQEADPANYDSLFIPGGFISPDLLRQSVDARDFARAFDTAGKPIATLCHGPWVLASAGILRGRIMTSWPGIRDDIVNAGAVWLDQEVVHDGNLVTSRGPQDMAAFVPAVVALFSGVPAPAQAAMTATSAPQRDQPPKAVLTAMKWLPRPSVRTALGIGAVALGIAAVRRRGAHA